jgi:hypothetical protein
MFDGRNTIQPLTSASTFPANLEADLKQQALEATLVTRRRQLNPPPLN